MLLNKPLKQMSLNGKRKLKKLLRTKLEYIFIKNHK